VGSWFSNPTGAPTATEGSGGGIGKYLRKAPGAPSGATGPDAGASGAGAGAAGVVPCSGAKRAAPEGAGALGSGGGRPKWGGRVGRGRMGISTRGESPRQVVSLMEVVASCWKLSAAANVSAEQNPGIQMPGPCEPWHSTPWDPVPVLCMWTCSEAASCRPWILVAAPLHSASLAEGGSSLPRPLLSP